MEELRHDGSESLSGLIGTGAEISPEAEMAMLVAEAKESLLVYMQACDKNYMVSKCHEAIASKLHEVETGKCKRLIISCPPRVGKSREVAIEFPTHYLGAHPAHEIAVASYAAGLAVEHSKAARMRIDEDEVYHAIFDTRLREGDNRQDQWRTQQGGAYRAVGIGGGLTGKGFHLGIIDDYHKDYQEAHSQAQRDKVWNWFWSVFYTRRMDDDAAIIVFATRWHPDDLIGRLTDPKRKTELLASGIDEEWDVLNIPALAELNDPLGREVGEAIFPERFSREGFEVTKASMGSYLWSALYQGSPTVKGGNYIAVSMIDVVELSDVPNPRHFVWAWDLAASTKTSADYTAGVQMSMGPDDTVYIMNVDRGQWPWPTSRAKIIQHAQMARPIRVGVETVAGFKTAYSNLMEVMPADISCSEFDADTDKLTHALPWIALVEKGKFKIVAGPWNVDYIRELEAFPTGANDDMVDGTSLAYDMLKGCAVLPRALASGERLRAAVAERRTRSMGG